MLKSLYDTKQLNYFLQISEYLQHDTNIFFYYRISLSIIIRSISFPVHENLATYIAAFYFIIIHNLITYDK